MLLSRRSSRDAEGADKIKIGPGFLDERECRNRSRRLHGDLQRGLRNRGLPGVADLAMRLVVRVDMPVADRVRGQQGHRKNQRSCQ